MYKNPTDYFMMVIKDSENAEKIADTFELKYGSQNGTKDLEEESNGNGIAAVASTMTLKRSDEVSVGWIYQTYIIWIRFMRSWMRHPLLFFGELTQYMFTGLFIGT